MKQTNIHFTPQKGWMNDPNGMVRVQGKYHLFYQHYPHDVVWGPMHWGHAVTEDLIHWEHKDIALYPDELGYIFSGSCVLDKENVSGFGTKENPPLIAVYTSHNPENAKEQQSIAYSLDYEHFETYEKNPVIPNTEYRDFRDPKVFANPIMHCFSLVLAAGEKVFFYRSENLKDWEKTGEFTPGDYGFPGVCECPDCFPLPSEDGEKWVLTVSMILPEEKVGKPVEENGCRLSHIMQYFVGEFDGAAFRVEEKPEQPLLLDYGTDNYAAVTFSNSDEKILLGWGTNWAYADKTPCEDYRGVMTLARSLSLVKTREGLRLKNVPKTEGLQGTPHKITGNGCPLGGEAFLLSVDWEETGEIRLSNSFGEEVRIQVLPDEIVVDRTKSGRGAFCEVFLSERYGCNRAKRVTSGKNHMQLILDGTFLEVYGEDGLLPFSVSVFPNVPYDQITFTGAFQAEILTY